MTTTGHLSTMDENSKVWVRIEGSSQIWVRGIVMSFHKVDDTTSKFDISLEEHFDLTGGNILIASKLVHDSIAEYEHVKLRNVQDDDGVVDVDDLTSLHNLHEPAILNCLQSRYLQGNIYSATGPILISINPFQKLQIYDSEHVNRYSNVGQSSYLSNSISPIKPHIYRIADAAYRKMVAGFRTGESNQSILVSGESGSGKTEATKYIMRYLADITAPRSHDGLDDVEIEQQVLRSNPILESFGNARTVRNDNSSRFGKFIEINFVMTRNGLDLRIRGAIIRTYLLEKVRLVHQAPGERNFHCFYELLSGCSKEERTRLSLTSPDDYHYTNQSGTVLREHDGIDDGSLFICLQESMNALNISFDEQYRVRNVLAAILHLGNLRFQVSNGIGDDEEGSELLCTDIAIAHHLTQCASLLGVSDNGILSVLCQKTIRTPDGDLLKRQTREEAEFARDALAKTLYGALFDFLVQRVNSTIGAKLCVDAGGTASTPIYLSPLSKESWRIKQRRAFIGVLDIFGFESFATNSFEQLCINYTNEALQHHFNSFVFQHEQTLYQQEGIAWDFISFPDNREVLDLLENRRTGIYALCDEQLRFPKASDTTLVNKFYEHCTVHPRFRAGPVDKASSQFVILHYAGEVTYSARGFLEKNSDMVRGDVCDMLRGSTCWLVQKLCEYFREDEPSISLVDNASAASHAPSTPVRRPSSHSLLKASRGSVSRRPSRVGNRRICTLGGEFQQQLAELMHYINQTCPHYVRCIKPNADSKPDKFDCAMVVQQLKCGGVLESVRVTRSGYAVRMGFEDFVKRYQNLVPSIKESITFPSVMDNAQQEHAILLCKELAQLMRLDKDFMPCLDASSQLDVTKLVGIQVGNSRVFMRRKPFDYLETWKLASVRSNVVMLQSVIRRHLGVKKWRETKKAIIVLQCAFRVCIAERELASRRKVKAILSIQRVYRGHRVRCSVRHILQSLLLLQTVVRRRIAIVRTNLLRRRYKAAVCIQASVRCRQSRRVYLQRLKDTTALQKISEERDKLELRVRNLEAILESSGSSLVSTAFHSRAALAVDVQRSVFIEDIQEKNALDRMHHLETEVKQLQNDIQQVVTRAAVCLGIHEERARTLLLTDSDAQFDLFHKGVTTPSKGSLHPKATPSPSKGKRLTHGTETDDVYVGEEGADSERSEGLPSLPAYKSSTDPGREAYLQTMYHLLLEAVQNGEVETARYVLSSCPKVITLRSKERPLGGGESRNQTILHTVCEQQHIDFVDLFLQYNPDPNAQTTDGKSYLHLASDPIIVEMLCIDGADPNLLDKTGQTPLHVYVAHKLYECARSVIRRGADPNIEDWRNHKSPLQSAAAMGDYRLLHILLCESTVPPKIDKPDYDGNTLLHLVCMTEAPGSQVHKSIMLLLDRGASPRAVNIRGITPLHFIAGNQYIWHSTESSKEEVIQLVQLLLSLSVDVNAKDSDGCTALVVACAHRKFELCQTLLKYNADMNIPCAMNSYLLRRGNHSEEEGQVDGLDLTASDLFPPGRRRNEIFAYISCRQTPVDRESRSRCMNCAGSIKGGFFSHVKINCGMCGRVVCEECTDRQKVVRADRAPPFLVCEPGDDLIQVCIVCGPIIAENYRSALNEPKARSGSKGFLNW